jgi:hypothetical protein
MRAAQAKRPVTHASVLIFQAGGRELEDRLILPEHRSGKPLLGEPYRLS